MNNSNNKLSIHTNAVNLARRWSAQNENDLMQEDFFEETPKLTQQQCQSMAQHMLHPSNLPQECRKYQDVVKYLKRHDTDTTHPTQFMS